MSLDKDHREKMDVLNEIIRLRKESNKRDVIVFVLSVLTNLVFLLVIRFL